MQLSWARPVYAPDTPAYTKFFNGSVVGDVQAIEEALQTGEIDVDACPKWDEWEGQTALHQAAAAGHIEIVKVLLDSGAEVDRRDSAYPAGPKTPIHLAAYNGHLSIVKLLLEHGADVSTRGEMDAPLLNYVLWNKETLQPQDYEMINLILDQGYDIHSWQIEVGGTALHLAAEIGDVKLIRLLVSRGADCNFVIPEYEDYTVLRSAVTDDQKEAANLLINLGAHVTPLVFSCARSMGMVELLQPHLDQISISRSGLLVNICCGVRNVEFVRELLQRNIANVDDKKSNGDTALLAICSQRYCSLEILEILLEAGADANVKGTRTGASKFIFRGDTPLHRAVVSASPDVVKYLLGAGADLEAKDEHGQTPLILLAYSIRNHPRTEIFQTLINAGADVNAINNKSETVLHSLALNKAHSTSSEEILALVQLLLDSGASIKLLDSNGQTALDLFSLDAQFYDRLKQVPNLTCL